MALVVENGSGVFGANSYVTVAEADLYFAQVGNEVWGDVDVTPTQKEQALVRALRYMEKRFKTRFGGSILHTTKYRAEATLTFSSNPAVDDSFQIGSHTYKFVSSIADGYDLLIGERTRESMNAAVAAVNGQVGFYHPSTPKNSVVDAFVLNGRQILFAVVYNGEDGNDVICETLGTSMSFASDTFTGGNEIGVSQPLSFPRYNLYIGGTPVNGIPSEVKIAQFEYAVRALQADLMPDPLQDESGRFVVAKTEKVGPIEESYTYSENVAIENALRSYPGADSILRPLLGSGSGGVTR